MYRYVPRRPIGDFGKSRASSFFRLLIHISCSRLTRTRPSIRFRCLSMQIRLTKICCGEVRPTTSTGFLRVKIAFSTLCGACFMTVQVVHRLRWNGVLMDKRALRYLRVPKWRSYRNPITQPAYRQIFCFLRLRMMGESMISLSCDFTV